MSENEHLREVRCYFTDQEWADMPDLMKERCANIKRNYDVMVALDLKPAVPEFMKPKPKAPELVPKRTAQSRSKKKQPKKPANTAAQAPKTSVKGKINSGGVKLAPRKKTRTAPVQDHAVVADNTQLAAGAATDQKSANASGAGRKRPSRGRKKIDYAECDDSDGELTDNPFASTSNDSPGDFRYPRRQHKKVSYVECEEGPDEEYPFCDDWKTDYLEDCPVHGPLTQGKDTAMLRSGSWKLVKAIIYEGAVCNHTCEVMKVAEELFLRYGDELAKQLGLIDNAGELNQGADKDVAAPREDCGKLSAVKQLLDHHGRRKHLQMRQGKYHCTHCPYSTYHSSNMTKHERIHTGERPFVCHVCDRGFTERRNFNRHLLVHTGEKPHECPDCGQRFTRASDMARHRRQQHSAESARRHVCPECGKGFTKRGHFDNHLLTHTGEKPHACSECGMRFAQRGHARRHEQAVHGHQYPLHCPHCGKGFVKTNDLRRHVRSRHRDEDDDDQENDDDDQ